MNCHTVQGNLKKRDTVTCSLAFQFPVKLNIVNYKQLKTAAQLVNPQRDSVVLIHHLNDKIRPLTSKDMDSRREQIISESAESLVRVVKKILAKGSPDLRVIISLLLIRNDNKVMYHMCKGPL